MKSLESVLKKALEGASLSLDEKQLFQSQVKGLTSDSRKIQPDFLFVAVGGQSHDGHLFIEAAVANGASAIICERPLNKALAIPMIKVSDSREALARLSAAFYEDPSLGLLLVGVTGTSGKTTVTYILESILKSAGHRVGVIGTVNFRFGSKIFESTHTTPGPVELQNLLYMMKKEGCTAVVMEVSSHGLKQKRTSGIAFDAMGFTNLSPEHLDFHPDMEDYFQSKRLLFTELGEYALSKGKSPVAAINAADPYGQRLVQDLKTAKSRVQVRTFTDPSFEVSLNGIRGRLGAIQVDSSLTGSFNAANIALAATLAEGLGIKPDVIAKGITQTAAVPGRLERVVIQSETAGAKQIHVWVDYAHKPDALEKVIRTLGQVRAGKRLITVFGCGGDRDRKKRPVMGKIAVEGSDYVWITSDNPRTEDPQKIIDEILIGTAKFSNFTVEPDRRKAIFGAIAMAQAGDLVLIAGKGHETYQILGTSKTHFDDREVAAEALSVAKA